MTKVIAKAIEAEFKDKESNSGVNRIYNIGKVSDSQSGREYARTVMVEKSEKNGKQYYSVLCQYEDLSKEWKYTDDLSLDSLEKVLQEVYDREVCFRRKLKQCPFCGGQFQICDNAGHTIMWGICRDCGMLTPQFRSENEVVKFINTRKLEC